MASIVTRADLARLYTASLEGFVPTHRVRVVDAREKKTLREDLVRLEDGEGTRYAYRPGEEEPSYYQLDTGLWKTFESYGIVEGKPVLYRPNYVRPSERDGLVYFVEAGTGGPIKIGWSADVARRIAELQTANAHPLHLLGTVPGTMENEAEMHARFAHLRMEAEWFQNSDEIHAFLREASVEDPIEGS